MRQCGRRCRRVLRRRPERCAAGAVSFPANAPAFAGARARETASGSSARRPAAMSGLRRGRSSTPAGPKTKTGPVLPPAPSQVPAGVFPPRSVPNRVLQEQAPPGPIRDHRSKLQPIPADFHGASPASACRTSFRRTGDHPRNVFPASRRPFRRASIRQAGDFPSDILPASRRLSVAALFRRANPAS